jgi:hypothetical protein
MGPYIDTAKKVAPVVAAAYITQRMLAAQHWAIQGLAMLGTGALAFKFVSSKL